MRKEKREKMCVGVKELETNIAHEQIGTDFRRENLFNEQQSRTDGPLGAAKGLVDEDD
jgi:hypothetical protein